MTVRYSRRALQDIEAIGARYEAEAGTAVAARFAQRLSAVVQRVERRPASARAVQLRPGVRVAPLITFPFVIFFREAGDGTVEVLHIRHVARAPGP